MRPGSSASQHVATNVLPPVWRESRWIQPSGVVAEKGVYLANSWFAARRMIELNQESSELVVQVAADSKYWLYLDGQLVVREGGLKRGPTPEGTYFDRVPITGPFAPGRHQLAILLWHFGRDGFSHKDSGAPGLLVVVFDAAGRSVLAGDEPWKMRRHPAFTDAGYLRDAYRLPESSLCFDARKDLSQWTSATYDDGDWPEAVIGASPGAGPWGPLYERPIPQWKWSEARSYDRVEVDTSGAEYNEYRCRISHEAFFVPMFEARAVAGLRIDCHVVSSTNCLLASYITRQGLQAFEWFGWLAGHEVVYRFPKSIRSPQLGYRESGYDAHFRGFFHCDDAFLNRLWRKSRRTLYMTMRDTFMDCPCRERAQWPGDFVVQLGQVPYCLSRRADFLIRKALLEFARWQKQDGSLFGPIPAGNWEHELPSQMLSMLSRFGVWTYYMNSGDKATLREFHPAIKRYLALWKTGADGLVEYRKGGWDWLDWGHDFDSHALLSFWHILALEGAELSAAALGFAEEASEFRAQAEMRREAMRRICWNGSGYRHPGYEGAPDDRTQALAILSRTAHPGQWPQLRHGLLSHQQASPYMEKYVLEALLETGAVDEALARLRARFAGMADSPGTTLWEIWPEWEQGSSTWCHSWSGGPLVLMSQYLAGLAPIEPGWSQFQIRPQPGLRLKSIAASLDLPTGPASLQWKRPESGGSTLKVVIPAGTRAHFIPDGCLGGEPCEVLAVQGTRWQEWKATKPLWLDEGAWEITVVAKSGRKIYA